MNSKSVPFLKLVPLRKEVRSAIEEVLARGVLMNGEFTVLFKESFSNYIGLDYVIPTANCTDSLELILRNEHLQAEDEVITSAFSWFSDASVVKILGHKLVFCDIDLSHFGITARNLKKVITEKTKAIILPHLFGQVNPEIEAIVQICKDHNILLIEDCAQAHGATFNGKMCGTFGDVAAFSFYPTKNLGAIGDAGAIATNDRLNANSYFQLANHGQSSRNVHEQIGKNSRMDEIQAAVLNSNLPFLNENNQRRRKLAKIYFDTIQSDQLQLPENESGHIFHQFVIRTRKRDELRTFLNTNNIETDIHYPTALSDMKVFDSTGNCPNASEAANTVLSLPIHPNHTEEDILYVAEKVNDFFKT